MRRSELYLGKIDTRQMMLLKVDNAVIEKTNSLKTEARVQAIYQNHIWKKKDGRLLIYFQKDSVSKKLKMGDEFITSIKPDSISPPKNPGQFNYQRFLGFKNIFHQAYVSSNTWKKVEWNRRFYWTEMFYKAQQNLLKVINRYPFGNKEKAVVSALVLGNRDEIDHDLLLAYSASGAMHVLSVSGLHVGLIYIIFTKLLNIFDKRKKYNLTRCILILLLLWTYAGISGFSASVLRSAVMFSSIAVANAFKKNNNIYNTLAASAFVLLAIYPNMLFEVGFQLSYLAVVGIIYIQPKIYNLLYAKNYILDQLWKISSISLAAQLATFPLGLLYFHQFPNYFLLSNFIVIPAAILILYGGILMVIFQQFDFIFQLVAKGVDLVTRLLNYTVVFTEKLPFSMVKGIHISIFETYTVYFAIVLFFIYVNKPKVKTLFAFLMCIVFILSSQLVESIQQNRQAVFTVYDVKKNFVVNFFAARKNYLFADSATLNNQQNLRFNVFNNWYMHSVENANNVRSDSLSFFSDKNIFINESIIQFRDKKIIVIDDFSKIGFYKNQVFDIAILTNYQKINLKDLLKDIKIKELIVDAKNKYYEIAKLKIQGEALDFPIYFTSEKGAYQKNF